MATYDRFTPVNIRVNYNMNSAESTDAFKNLQTKILDKFSSPGVEIARDSVDIERIYRPFEVYINGGLVFSKYRFGHYPSAGDINSIIDVAKEVYHGGEPRSIDSYTVTVGGLD
ncbi:uncharacterized protein [Dysidea avara]|uniref:uncharacterized protein n=1 Tax=Dysidea avara TaxID=196820 RepID=UPI0033267444